MKQVEGELLDEVPNRESLEQLASIYGEAYPESGKDTREIIGSIRSQETDIYAIKRYGGEFDGEYVAVGNINYGQGAVLSELTEAAVRPDVQDEGLGAKLFSDRAEIARRKGNGKVITWASTENPAAQAVAEKEGFQPSGVEVNRTSPRGDDRIHNILMVDPETLYEKHQEVHASEEMLDAIGSILDTEIGNGLDREVKLLEDHERPEYGFVTENFRDVQSTLTYGMQKFGDSSRINHGPLDRVAGDGTIEEAWSETLDEGYTTAFVNISEPGSSAAAAYLIEEEDLVPTGINPSELTGADGMSFKTSDMVILSEVEQPVEVDATEEVGEWLDEVEIPVYAQNQEFDSSREESSQREVHSTEGTMEQVKDLLGRFLD